MAPGIFISALTFPGVIVHEMAHQLFCRLRRMAVLEVCYFRFGIPAGFVVHETPKSTADHILIGVAPFLVNSILGAVIALPGFIPFWHMKSFTALDAFLMWLGVSIAMHSFPSTGDAANIWQSVRGETSSPWARLLGTPIVGLIYLGALGSMLWLDLIYAMAVTAGLAHLVVTLAS